MSGWRSLHSSHITQAKYEEETSTLLVRFSNGSEYAYDGVSPDDAEGFMEASSAGSYLRSHLDGVYKHRKVG